MRNREFTTGGFAAARLALLFLNVSVICIAGDALFGNRFAGIFDGVGVVVLFWGGLYGVRALRRRPLFSVSAIGLNDVRSGQLVPWSEVTDVRTRRLRLIVANRVTEAPLAYRLFDLNEKTDEIVDVILQFISADRAGAVAGALAGLGASPPVDLVEIPGASSLALRPPRRRKKRRAPSRSAVSRVSKLEMLVRRPVVAAAKLLDRAKPERAGETIDSETVRRRIFWIVLAAIWAVSCVDLWLLSGDQDRRVLLQRLLFSCLLSLSWLFGSLFWATVSDEAPRPRKLGAGS